MERAVKKGEAMGKRHMFVVTHRCLFLYSADGGCRSQPGKDGRAGGVSALALEKGYEEKHHGNANRACSRANLTALQRLLS